MLSASSSDSSSAPTASVSLSSPPRFDGRNFPVWKDKFLSYLFLNGLGDVLEASDSSGGNQESGAKPESAAATRVETTAHDAESSAESSVSTTGNKDEEKGGSGLAEKGRMRADARAMKVHSLLILSMGDATLSDLIRDVPRGEARRVWRILEA